VVIDVAASPPMSVLHRVTRGIAGRHRTAYGCLGRVTAANSRHAVSAPQQSRRRSLGVSDHNARRSWQSKRLPSPAAVPGGVAPPGACRLKRIGLVKREQHERGADRVPLCPIAGRAWQDAESKHRFRDDRQNGGEGVARSKTCDEPRPERMPRINQPIPVVCIDEVVCHLPYKSPSAWSLAWSRPRISSWTPCQKRSCSARSASLSGSSPCRWAITDATTSADGEDRGSP